MDWFRGTFMGRTRDGRRKDKRWNMSIGEKIWITVPPGLPSDYKWEVWGNMQITILSRIQQHWPESYSYIRFNPFPAGYFEDKLTTCDYEILKPNDRTDIFLLPDCKAGPALDTVFSILGINPFTRCIFILDRKPTNWQEVVNSLYEASKKLLKKKPVTEHENELAMCHCLAYSVNQDLVINKIDMPKEQVMEIIEDIARKEGLFLNIRSKS